MCIYIYTCTYTYTAVIDRSRQACTTLYPLSGCESHCIPPSEEGTIPSNKQLAWFTFVAQAAFSPLVCGLLRAGGTLGIRHDGLRVHRFWGGWNLSAIGNDKWQRCLIASRDVIS